MPKKRPTVPGTRYPGYEPMTDEDEFDRLFRQSRVFMIIVWVLVVAFFAAILTGAVFGLVWLGRTVL